jgi:hypothetical protein
MDLRMPIDCAPHSRWRADIHAGAIRNGELITRSSESYAGALISLLQPESAQTNIPMRETARLAASAARSGRLNRCAVSVANFPHVFVHELLSPFAPIEATYLWEYR